MIAKGTKYFNNARRRRIFGDKVLPNLVLLARELERYQGKT
jgi:hypothetical protein